MKISVGGMIGVGKTTFSKQLAKVTGLPLIKEFDDNDEMFNTMLDWMYKGYENSELIFQTYFINHTHQMHIKKNVDINNCVTDRHIIEHERFAFFNLRNKDTEAYSHYMSLFNSLLANDKLPDLYIILYGSFNYCLNNIKKRGRPQEIDNLERNMDYFKILHFDYVCQLSARCITFGVPFRILDVEKNEQLELLDKLRNDKNYLDKIYLGDLRV